MFETLKYEVKDGIAYITVNRPEALNALNSKVLAELYDAFAEFDADEAARVAILTGEGRSFVAGADIAEMAKLNTIEARVFAKAGHRTMNFIENVSKPVIAAVNGFALGGGCELSMACDIRIASAKAKFIGAEEAGRIGLVEKVVEPEELMPACEELAKKIMSKAPIAVSIAKHAINNGYDMDMKSASELEVNSFGLSFSSEDMKEGTAAFLEKRPAEFKNK